ncbi:MAG: RNA 2',3'-cyclic phosphodiesterase [Bacteroidales bacterium]|jgi:2'-5' RNA ligase|nr:RNA 2',3'-cyclic phosphodiesterase [Bacteroidales bacterium]HOI32354.1 RNA 2',3'-cyclic phosphodiesterase [Bacteroidales bacterium]
MTENALKRLFIALPLPDQEPLIELLEKLRNQLGHEKINWVKTENLHLTLKFLGPVRKDLIPQIISATKGCILHHKNFTLDFNKTGVFGSRYDPKVIWLGTNTPPEELFSLTENLLSQMDRIGFKRDRQNFVPHLTLCRIKQLNQKSLFQQVVQNIPQQTYLKTTIKEVRLYESILHKTGPEYQIVERFSLT